METTKTPAAYGEILQKHCISHWLSNTEGIQADEQTSALVAAIDLPLCLDNLLITEAVQEPIQAGPIRAAYQFVIGVLQIEVLRRLKQRPQQIANGNNRPITKTGEPMIVTRACPYF